MAAVRRPAKPKCYIGGCTGKSAVWIVRWEGSPDTGRYVEAKVCPSHAHGQQNARNQDG